MPARLSIDQCGHPSASGSCSDPSICRSRTGSWVLAETDPRVEPEDDGRSAFGDVNGSRILKHRAQVSRVPCFAYTASLIIARIALGHLPDCGSVQKLVGSCSDCDRCTLTADGFEPPCVLHLAHVPITAVQHSRAATGAQLQAIEAGHSARLEMESPDENLFFAALAPPRLGVATVPPFAHSTVADDAEATRYQQPRTP